MNDFLVLHKGTHPRGMAEMDVSRFPAHLAAGANVSASTQNQALAAVLFLCEQVLERPLDRVARRSRPRWSTRKAVTNPTRVQRGKYYVPNRR
jgi:hypothetical protein